MASDQEACAVDRESPEPHLDSVISFIIKIWLEDAWPRGKRPRWRARITHVPGGEQRYLTDLDEISSFIMPYLAEKGVRPGWWWRVRQRLSHWQRGFRGPG
jgi:hypothetical protein